MLESTATQVKLTADTKTKGDRAAKADASAHVELSASPRKIIASPALNDPGDLQNTSSQQLNMAQGDVLGNNFDIDGENQELVEDIMSHSKARAQTTFSSFGLPAKGSRGVRRLNGGLNAKGIYQVHVVHDEMSKLIAAGLAAAIPSDDSCSDDSDDVRPDTRRRSTPKGLKPNRGNKRNSVFHLDDSMSKLIAAAQAAAIPSDDRFSTDDVRPDTRRRSMPKGYRYSKRNSVFHLDDSMSKLIAAGQAAAIPSDDSFSDGTEDVRPDTRRRSMPKGLKTNRNNKRNYVFHLDDSMSKLMAAAQAAAIPSDDGFSDDTDDVRPDSKRRSMPKGLKTNRRDKRNSVYHLDDSMLKLMAAAQAAAIPFDDSFSDDTDDVRPDTTRRSMPKGLETNRSNKRNSVFQLHDSMLKLIAAAQAAAIPSDGSFSEDSDNGWPNAEAMSMRQSSGEQERNYGVQKDSFSKLMARALAAAIPSDDELSDDEGDNAKPPPRSSSGRTGSLNGRRYEGKYRLRSRSEMSKLMAAALAAAIPSDDSFGEDSDDGHTPVRVNTAPTDDMHRNKTREDDQHRVVNDRLAKLIAVAQAIEIPWDDSFSDNSACAPSPVRSKSLALTSRNSGDSQDRANSGPKVEHREDDVDGSGSESSPGINDEDVFETSSADDDEYDDAGDNQSNEFKTKIVPSTRVHGVRIWGWLKESRPEEWRNPRRPSNLVRYRLDILKGNHSAPKSDEGDTPKLSRTCSNAKPASHEKLPDGSSKSVDSIIYSGQSANQDRAIQALPLGYPTTARGRETERKSFKLKDLLHDSSSHSDYFQSASLQQSAFFGAKNLEVEQRPKSKRWRKVWSWRKKVKWLLWPWKKARWQWWRFIELSRSWAQSRRRKVVEHCIPKGV